jgi:hypothetical protein
MRRTALLLLLVVLGALAGCGGSVADRDGPAPVRASTAPPSPFCTALEASLQATAPLANRTGVPAEELTNAVEAARRANTELVDTAPPTLRADVQRYVAALDLQLAALLANGGDTVALRTDAALSSAVNTPETVAAGQRVQTYVQETCGSTAP